MDKSLKCPKCMYVINSFDETKTKGFCPECGYFIEDFKLERERFCNEIDNDVVDASKDLVCMIHKIWSEKILGNDNLNESVFFELKNLNFELKKDYPDLELVKTNQFVLENIFMIAFDKKFGLEKYWGISLESADNVFGYDFSFIKLLLAEWIVVGQILRMEENQYIESDVFYKLLTLCTKEELIGIIEEQVNIYTDSFFEKSWLIRTRSNFCEKLNNFLTLSSKHVSLIDYRYEVNSSAFQKLIVK